MDSTNSFFSHYYQDPQDFPDNLSDPQEFSLKDVFEEETSKKTDYLAIRIFQDSQNQISIDDTDTSLFSPPPENAMLVDEIQDVTFYDEFTKSVEISESHTSFLPKSIDQLLAEKKDFRDIKKKRLIVIKGRVPGNFDKSIDVVKVPESTSSKIDPKSDLMAVKSRFTSQIIKEKSSILAPYSKTFHISWTKELEQQLIDLVKERGTDWKSISIEMGLTKRQCSSKFSKLLKADPTLAQYLLKNNPWSAEKEQQLIDLVKIPGTTWKIISSKMGLTKGQCSGKFFELKEKDPTLAIYSLKNDTWSEEKEHQLIELVKIYGTAWKIISSEIGLTKNQCQTRFFTLIKKNPSLAVYSKIKHNKWTEEQVQQLIELVEIYGTNWKIISSKTGLTERQCLCKFSKLRKKDPTL